MQVLRWFIQVEPSPHLKVWALTFRREAADAYFVPPSRLSREFRNSLFSGAFESASEFGFSGC